MGGHGALVIAMKNQTRFRSVSVLAPISNPSKSPWGVNAMRRFLGSSEEKWKEFDSVEIALKLDTLSIPMLIEQVSTIDCPANANHIQGSKDQYLDDQLRTGTLVDMLRSRGFTFEFRLRDGYDHSYYFISTFIEDHIAFHAKHLTSK
jgi:S-formylglutathione hydrolase